MKRKRQKKTRKTKENKKVVFSIDTILDMQVAIQLTQDFLKRHFIC